MYISTHNTSDRGSVEVGVVVEDVGPRWGSHRSDERAKIRHQSRARTIVADVERKPDRQHGHNRRAKKLEAFGYHDGVADGLFRMRPELGHVAAAETVAGQPRMT